MTDAADTGLTDFAWLLPDDLGRPMTFAKGGHIFATGDRAHALFRVITGTVRLIRHAIDGSDVTLHIAKPGGSFAEASLFSDTYHCDAVADLPTTVLAFDKSHILTSLQRDPGHAMRWIELLSKQVQSLRAHAACLSLNAADDRVLTFLRMQCLNELKARIDRPWKAIASELGLSHEALYRTLARLERQGVIERDRASSTVELKPDRSRRSS